MPLRDDFAALVGREADCGLARGALEIARIAYPALEPAHYLTKLDELAEGTRARMAGGLPPEVLTRMLRNLVRVYLDRRDTALALAAVDLLLVLLPDSPDDLRTRGALYESLDCAAAALADFRRYLALAPTAPDADDVRERLTRLARTNPTIH